MRALLLFVVFAVACEAQAVIGGITNSASYTGQIAPGGIATIFGTGLGNGTNEATTIPLPATLSDVTLTIGGYTCPLLFANETQINFQVPAELGPGQQQLVLTTDFGQQTGIITLLEAGPALFQYGVNQAFAVNYTTGAINAPDQPVAANDYLIVYLTGIGPLSATPQDGSPAEGLSTATDVYSATIGGIDAPVAFLGLAPGYVGLDQANIQVPQLANGNYPLVITVNGNVSTSAVVTVSGTGVVQPNVLTFLSSVGLPTESLDSDVQGSSVVQANGQYVYVCSASQITAVDVSNPAAPVAVSGFGQTQLNGQGVNCTISNGYLIEVVNGDQEVVFDLLTSATQPSIVSGPTDLAVGPALNLAAIGNTVFFDGSLISVSNTTGDITSESGSVLAYDFTNVSSPFYVSTYAAPAGFANDSSPRGGLAVLSNQYLAVAGTTNTGGSPTDGQAIVDVLNVSNPSDILGSEEVPIPYAVVAQSIAVQGTEALVVGNTQAISNPVTFSGNSPQFLSMGNLTLSLLDVTNPQNVGVISSEVTDFGSSFAPYVTSLGGGFFAVSHVRSFADAGGAGTLAVVDANNPASLNWIPVATIYGVFGMAAQGGYLYVNTNSGLNVYQITLPNGAVPSRH